MKYQNKLIEIAIGAGAIAIQERDKLAIQIKEDGSPRTSGDMKVALFVIEELRKLDSGIPIIDEEIFPFAPHAELPEVCFVLDPIDGTKEFASGMNDFAINIAAISAQEAQWGVIHAPSHGETFWGDKSSSWKMVNGHKSKLKRFFCEAQLVRRPVRVAQSIFHHDPQLEVSLAQYFKGPFELCPIGASLKFCRLAEGAIDIYLRTQSLKIWDVAAGFAILEGVGLPVLGLDGRPIKFKQGIQSPPFCVSRIPIFK